MHDSISIANLLQDRAEKYPDKKIFTFLKEGEIEAESLTYQQLLSKSQQLASLLIRKNLSGKVVVLLYPQGLEFIIALFACFYAKIIAVPTYPPTRNKLKRLQSILNNSDAKLILSNQKVFNKSTKFSSQLIELQWLLTDNLPITTSVDFPKVESNDIAFLQYTSGSTGQPKGVMISHQNIITNSAFLKEAFELSDQDICVSWLPLFHDMGLIDGVIQPIYSNYAIYLMNPTDFVQKPIRWLGALSKFKATRTGGPNFAYDLCVEKISEEDLNKLDLSSVNCLYNGSEPVSSVTLNKFMDKFKETGLKETVFYPCYGMAEATLQVTGIAKRKTPTILRVAKKQLKKNLLIIEDNPTESISLVSCGYPRLDTQIRIVNPTSKQLAKTIEIGEIWVKGKSISEGYWNNSAITAENFLQTIKDTQETGFYRTGDLGFFYQEELFITGRIKELIIIRGQNYYPQDIERILQDAHPALQNGGTVAFSTIEEKEQLIIVQEIKRTFIRELKEVEVFNAIKNKIATFLEVSVDAIFLVTPFSLPKTTSGKLMRKQCQKDYLTGKLSPISSWEMPKQNPIANITEEISKPTDKQEDFSSFLTHLFAKKSGLPVTQISPNTSFLDIGIDSIYAVDMTVEIEKKLGLKVTATIFWELKTIESIAKFLYEKKKENDRLASV